MAKSKKLDSDAQKPAAEWVLLTDLVPWDKNPRKNDEAVKEVAKSIKRLGFGAPIVARREDRTVIAGHTRLRAAKLLKLDRVPVRYVDISPADSRLMSLADNRIGETAEWDNKLLAEVLGEFSFDDIELAGWDQRDLDKLGLDILNGNANTDIDAEPQMNRASELQKQWGTELGQLWRCGEHLILCGDSADPECVKRVMGQERAHLVFTDPPYGVSISKANAVRAAHGVGKATADIVSDDLSPEELKAKIQPAFENIRKLVMSDDCTVFVTAPQGGDLGMMMMMMRDAGLPPRHVLIWDKEQPTFSMGRLDYDYEHEPILLTWGKRHKRPMLGEHKTSVWRIHRPQKSLEHPTMKPVELYVNALLNNSEANDIAYDAYSGSGTMMLACEQTGRRARVIELMPGYVAVTLQRYKDATGNVPKLVS